MKRKRFDQTLPQLQKQTEDDEKVIAFKEEVLRQQLELEGDVKELQEAGLANVQSTLANKLELARVANQEVGVDENKENRCRAITIIR